MILFFVGGPWVLTAQELLASLDTQGESSLVYRLSLASGGDAYEAWIKAEFSGLDPTSARFAIDTPHLDIGTMGLGPLLQALGGNSYQGWITWSGAFDTQQNLANLDPNGSKTRLGLEIIFPSLSLLGLSYENRGRPWYLGMGRFGLALDLGSQGNLALGFFGGLSQAAAEIETSQDWWDQGLDQVNPGSHPLGHGGVEVFWEGKARGVEAQHGVRGLMALATTLGHGGTMGHQLALAWTMSMGRRSERLVLQSNYHQSFDGYFDLQGFVIEPGQDLDFGITKDWGQVELTLGLGLESQVPQGHITLKFDPPGLRSRTIIDLDSDKAQVNLSLGTTFQGPNLGIQTGVAIPWDAWDDLGLTKLEGLLLYKKEPVALEGKLGLGLDSLGQLYLKNLSLQATLQKRIELGVTGQVPPGSSELELLGELSLRLGPPNHL